MAVTVTTLALLHWTCGVARAADADTVNHWTILTTIQACSLGQAVSVQKEIGLSSKETTELKRLAAKWKDKERQLRREHRNLPPQQLAQLHGDLNADILKVILPEQFSRLRQIQFQCAGVAQVAVQHEDSPTLFGLSREQHGKLLAAEMNYAHALAETSMKAVFGNLKATVNDRPEIVALRKKRNETAMQLLTERQQNAWRKLTGKPFAGSLRDANGKRVHPKLISLP